MILGHGLALALVGIGLVGAIVLSRLISSSLYEIAPTDPLTYGVISALLVVVAATACYIPARTAAKAEPTVILQEG